MNLWLWIAVGVSTVLAVLWMVKPLIARNRVEVDESEHALSIFRDQMDEIDRDASLGFISDSERDQAELEIERRAARAAKERAAGIAVARRSPVLAGVTAMVAVAGSVGLYLWLGSPAANDQPLAARRAAIEAQLARAETADAARSADSIGASADADTFESWWIRARQFSAEGDHVSAADAYKRAAELAGDPPSVVSAYAEALTLANGNKVPAAARIVFQQVLTKTPNDPRARYYLALAKAQAQDFEGALDAWLQLLGDSDPGAPWARLVRRDIVNMTRFLKWDLASILPDASEEELARAAAAVRATAFKREPASAKPDWRDLIELARRRAADGDVTAADRALEQARQTYAGAPFVLSQIDAAAAEIGLAEISPPGPTPEQVAASAKMSEKERDQMIRGMVDGLAARLEKDPADIDGWLMLIRSYAVLQERELALNAARDALNTFTAKEERSRVLRAAAELGLVVN